MALHSGAPVPRSSFSVVLRYALTVIVSRPQEELRRLNVLFSRSARPCDSFRVVSSDAPARCVGAGYTSLRIRVALSSCTMVPVEGLYGILRDATAMRVRKGETRLRSDVSQFGSPAVPDRRFGMVRRDSQAVLVQRGKDELRPLVILFGRTAEPRCGFGSVARYATAVQVHPTEGVLGLGEALCGSTTVPRRSFDIVAGDATTRRVSPAEDVLCLGITFLSNAAKPRDRLGIVASPSLCLRHRDTGGSKGGGYETKSDGDDSHPHKRVFCFPSGPFQRQCSRSAGTRFRTRDSTRGTAIHWLRKYLMINILSDRGIGSPSFRDWAAEKTDHPREVVEAALAHVAGNKIEAAHARSDLFERRRLLMDEWTTGGLSRGNPSSTLTRPPAEPRRPRCGAEREVDSHVDVARRYSSSTTLEVLDAVRTLGKTALGGAQKGGRQQPPYAQRGGVEKSGARCARYAVAALCAPTETSGPGWQGYQTTPAREGRWRDVAGTGAVEVFADDRQTRAGEYAARGTARTTSPSPSASLNVIEVPVAPSRASLAWPAGSHDDDGGVASVDDLGEDRAPGLVLAVGHDERGSRQLVAAGERGDPVALEDGAPLAVGEPARLPTRDGRLVGVGLQAHANRWRVGFRLVGFVGELLFEGLADALAQPGGDVDGLLVSELVEEASGFGVRAEADDDVRRHGGACYRTEQRGAIRAHGMRQHATEASLPIVIQ